MSTRDLKVWGPGAAGMLAGAATCAVAVVENPPLTALWAPGIIVGIWGWARHQRQLRAVERARRLQYLALCSPEDELVAALREIKWEFPA